MPVLKMTRAEKRTDAMKQAKRILNVTIKRMLDSDPDTSWMGEFSGHADTQFAIDHQNRMGSNRVHQWFNSGSVESFAPEASWIPADVQNKRQYWHDAMTKNAEQDYARMCALSDGLFEFIGVRADAKIVIGNLCQTTTSGGLWGIESDSEEAYLREEEENQLAELRDVLKELGFGTRAISAAFKDVTHIE